jgi:hypothetical protein
VERNARHTWQMLQADADLSAAESREFAGKFRQVFTRLSRA